jgi:hypothetical protein
MMVPTALVMFLLASGPGAENAASAGAPPRLQVEKPEARDETPAPRDLTAVRRIYVDVLTGGEAAAQFRDMLMASLQKTRLFIVTENEDRADAVLKGAADDKIFTDRFRSSESLNMHTQVSDSDHSSESRYYSEGESHSAGFGIGESESSNIQERKHEAFAAVRLVNREGDVIWSVTAESLGGKFLGARADVADKIARQLTADYHRLQSAPPNKEKGGSATVR